MSNDFRRVRGLDVASLEALVAVIEHKSFTAASRELGVTQPAVSATLKKLEERVGTSLILRTRKGATSTAAGALLVEATRNAFGGLELALQTISDQQEQPVGKIRLGCHESLAAYALPEFLAEFFVQYPKVEISLVNGRSQDVERAIVDGNIDIGLIVNPGQHPETVVSKMFNDSVVLLAAEDLKGKEPRLLIEERPLLYVPELVQSQRVLRDLSSLGIKPFREVTCSSLDLVKSLTLSGLGVGILPERVAFHGIDKKRLISLSPPMPSFADEIALLRRYDLPVTAAIRVVTDGLTAHCRKL